MDPVVPTSIASIPLPVVTNPLLSRVRIPGESFTLPSGGVFYTNGELSPDCENGEVHVYPMVAIDELVMKSVDKIFSGDAIKEVFARCIPDVLHPGLLSAKDVDFLLVALKKVSYGSTFEINYNHKCSDESKEHSYEIPLDPFLQGSKRINPTTVRASFQHTLDNGQVVTFKPATYDDVIKIYQVQQAQLTSDKDFSNEEMLRRLLMSISVLIESVDDTKDRALIIEWLKALPVSWLRSLSESAKNTTDWGIDFEVTIQCRDCGKEVKVPTPLNPISFFI